MVIRVMKLKEYKVLGHKVNYSVPENSAEFNSLDPKRPDAACEEAVANIVYRSMNPDTRYWFLHGRTEEDTKKLIETNYLKNGAGVIVGVEDLVNEMVESLPVPLEADEDLSRRSEEVLDKDKKVKMRDGVPITKFVEAEEAYYNRVIATLVAKKKFASEDLARAHFQPLIEQIASEVPFDVTEREKAERGPKKLAIKYKNAAAKSLTLGRVPVLNENQFKQINKVFEPTNDTTKMFAGTFLDKEGNEVQFNVSDKDAEALGWMIKEFFDWKNSQEMLTLAE